MKISGRLFAPGRYEFSFLPNENQTTTDRARHQRSTWTNPLLRWDYRGRMLLGGWWPRWGEMAIFSIRMVWQKPRIGGSVVYFWQKTMCHVVFSLMSYMFFLVYNMLSYDVLYKFIDTLPETNVAPEKRPAQQESNFLWLCLLQEGVPLRKLTNVPKK